jgi:hypothetical protein
VPIELAKDGAIVAQTFLSAVSPTFSRQALEIAYRAGRFHPRRLENLRNGRQECLRYRPRQTELVHPCDLAEWWKLVGQTVFRELLPGHPV